MKNLIVLFTALATGIFSVSASNAIAETAGHPNVNPAFGYGNSFIFVENGITFSVFPDGEFDFYVNNTPYSGAQVNIGFNAGYNYSNCLQYDDYGAVIQIVNTPVFYDHYGRVSQIGSVRIYYNNRRVIRIGGLYIYYNPYGVYSHCSGYINVYNRVYVYQPFHRYFVRPVMQFCIVSYQPYRQYYVPVRYTYYKPYVNNARTCYASVGTTYYYKQNNSRKGIYVNDKRVSRRNYDAYSKTASRRGASQDYNEVPKKNHAGSHRKTSKRGYTKTNEKPSGKSRSQQEKTSGKSNANSYKRSKNAAISESHKATRGQKTTQQRGVVRQSPSKKIERTSQYKSRSAGSAKTVEKPSAKRS